MSELNQHTEGKPSKLNRFKSQFLRSPSELNRLKKSGVFKHKRQNSLDEILDICISDQSNNKSAEKSHSETNDCNDINNTPKIKRVANLDYSPTKSVNSSDDSEPFSQPSSPNFKATIPKLSIKIEKPELEPRLETPNIEQSRLSKLKKKTISMLFDQSSVKSSRTPTPIHHEDQTEQTDSKSNRPNINRAYSEEKNATRANEKVGINNISTHLRSQNDLFRKRSKTLGSVENDLYQKRNNTIAKAFGSMVMMKPRGPVESPENGSESESAPPSRPSTPPKINDDDSPAQYVSRLIDDGFESEITVILSDSNSGFIKSCLDYFLESKFDFSNESLDISLRKFLLDCELPKEAQQIDRVLSSFSNRFYRCNEDLWDNPDQIYFITFSLVMLHTDHFNVNNKKKMSKEEFVKNTRVENNEKVNTASLSKEILEYYYDNITFAKFIQKNKPTNLQPASLYSLPRRIFSSASSTNLDALHLPNGPTINIRSQSVSSSTSQFFGVTQVDPYVLIATEQLDSLKLSNEQLDEEGILSKNLRSTFTESYYKKTLDDLLSSNDRYIKFNKECNWLTGKTEIRSKSDSHETKDQSKWILRVIKIAELYREETVKSSIFFTIGNSNKVIWKKCFGVLTTCGFFIFENMNFLAVSERERLLDTEHGPDEPLIIEILYDNILKSASKLTINGLFACEQSVDDQHIFNIYSTNKKELFSTNTFAEMASWIISINYVAALDSCYIDDTAGNDYEVVPMRNITVEEKIKKLNKNTLSSTEKINSLVKLQHHLNTLAPFSTKTRDDLRNYYKSLLIRIDWLWYEVERNKVYVKILESELQGKDDLSSQRTVDSDSFLENSFIREL